jgi:predicted  nucleic acid-binding Zn-ribbon protein
LLNLSGNPEMAEQLKVLKASSLGADDESKNLKLTNATLEKQVAAATADLEVTRTRLSTVEIDIMVAKRERDTYKAKYESCLETMKEHGIDIAPT